MLKSEKRYAEIIPMNPENFTQEDENFLRDSLKRCSAETVEKAVQLRKTGDAELAGPVVIGIIERFLEEDKRGMLQNAPDTLNMVEDLGLDSLTMVEIVLAVEDATGMKIDNDEIQKLKTIGDIKSFISSKINS